MTVENGNTVQIEYTGKLDDGTVFDESKKHGKPLEFQVGSKQVIPGFENAVLGMAEGEEKEVTIPKDEAYGDRREELVRPVPAEQLPEGAKEGSELMLGLPTGQQVPGKVTKIEGDTATIDLNHPLAGQTLHFTIKVVGIK